MYFSSGSLETNLLPQSDRRLKLVQSKTALEVERLVSKSYILRPTPPPRPSLPRIPTSSQSPSGTFSISEEKAVGEVGHNFLFSSHFTHTDEQVLQSNSPLPRSHSDHKPRPTSFNATFFPPQVYDLSSITLDTSGNLSSSEKDMRRKRIIKLRKILGEEIHPELLNPSETGSRNKSAFERPTIPDSRHVRRSLRRPRSILKDANILK